MKKSWIYWLRGLAIIAVVVCHQQVIMLHTSEWIQSVSLFSVSALIILMGVTQYLSSSQHSAELSTGILKSTVIKMAPCFFSYCVATAVYLFYYTDYNMGEFSTLLSSILNFSAAGPFYFVRYYVFFSLISPILFCAIKYISIQKRLYLRVSLYVVLVAGLFFGGYWLYDEVEVIGGSYLSLYTFGMILGKISEKEISGKGKSLLFPLSTIFLLVGYYLTQKFYWTIVGGEYVPNILDTAFPKLTINPPNLSIIMYTLGIMGFFGILFGFIKKAENIVLNSFLRIIEILGKYSLDIFLWHILIRDFLVKNTNFENIWVKRIIFYLMMFSIPILGRKVYATCKKKMVDIMKEIY